MALAIGPANCTEYTDAYSPIFRGRGAPSLGCLVLKKRADAVSEGSGNALAQAPRLDAFSIFQVLPVAFPPVVPVHFAIHMGLCSL